LQSRIQKELDPDMQLLESTIAVHCKAGKGRTGLLVCALLLFSEVKDTADEALEHYNRERTRNSKGLTIQSQIRYIYIFEDFLKKQIGRPYFKNSLLRYSEI
jgi:protein-tyrosine phosphatase